MQLTFLSNRVSKSATDKHLGHSFSTKEEKIVYFRIIETGNKTFSAILLFSFRECNGGEFVTPFFYDLDDRSFYSLALLAFSILTLN